MKKILFILAFFPLLVSAQTFGIKLAIPKDIVVVPAKTVTVDSIYIAEIIRQSISISVTANFYYKKQLVWDWNRRIILEGIDYDPNKDYTTIEIKTRIKALIQ